MPIKAIVTAAIAKKALENVVDDIYRLATGELRKKINIWKNKSKIETLYKKIKNIRKVKTIWQVEKEIDLLKFYYPSKIEVDQEPKAINDIDDLGYSGNILIQGMIGQGKSIFLRFLTSQEMIKGNAIPLFVELRRIRKNETLTNHLLEEAKSLGLEMDKQTFLFLAKHGKVILFLDAFDEIKESQRSKLITEIEQLAKRYDKLQIIVSSRPDSGIEASPFMRVYELCPLQGNDYKQVIDKMAETDDVASSIMKGIRKSKGKVVQLLTTPLMVALLMLRYRINQSIPENTIAFYDDLFNLLLVRHDKLKAGYIRPRKSSASDMTLFQVFTAICFLTRKSEEGTLNVRQLNDITKRAIEIIGQDYAADKIVADIMTITCLILEEGGECKFIHKSVQEYHGHTLLKNK
jgi:hypothetical protein